jgi:transglycosylase-like protein
MARFAVGAVFGLVVGIVGGAALGIRASSPEEDPALPAETVVTAIRVGLDARTLHAAASSVGTDAVTYLQSEGIIPRPPPPPAAPAEPPYGVWDRLVWQCEAPGIGWAANTGNGFYGGPQFTRTTWLAYGGGRYAPYAHQATRTQQIAIAEAVLRGQGWNAWPVCSRRLGLR